MRPAHPIVGFVGLRLLLLACALGASTSAWAQDARTSSRSRSLSELGYPSALLDTESPSSAYWLEIPGYWVYEGPSTLQLHYSFPPSQSPALSAR